MALGDNTTSPARGVGARGRHPYMIQHELNFATAASDKGTALAANDVIPGLTIPANTVILNAGLEVTEAHAGTSTDTDFDFGITGGDLDNFVDGFDFDGASVGDYAMKAGQTPVLVGATSDTIDIVDSGSTSLSREQDIKESINFSIVCNCCGLKFSFTLRLRKMLVMPG